MKSKGRYSCESGEAVLHGKVKECVADKMLEKVPEEREKSCGFFREEHTR